MACTTIRGLKNHLKAEFQEDLVIYSVETITMKVVQNILVTHLDVATRKARTSGN
jgi:hypothetical protein